MFITIAIGWAVGAIIAFIILGVVLRRRRRSDAVTMADLAGWFKERS
jgi:hypothetical protein